MMIQNDAQLTQVLEQMVRMVHALSALHTDVLPQSRSQFALMAEAPLEELRRLEQEFSAYVFATEENASQEQPHLPAVANVA